MIVGRVCHIGRHGDRPSGHDRQIGNEPFRPILRDQQNAVARHQAVSDEAVCQRLLLTCRRSPAEGIGVIFAAPPQEWRFPELACLGEKHLGQRCPVAFACSHRLPPPRGSHTSGASSEPDDWQLPWPSMVKLLLGRGPPRAYSRSISNSSHERPSIDRPSSRKSPSIGMPSR
jgi:hypothetical protein